MQLRVLEIGQRHLRTQVGYLYTQILSYVGYADNMKMQRNVCKSKLIRCSRKEWNVVSTWERKWLSGDVETE